MKFSFVCALRKLKQLVLESKDNTNHSCTPLTRSSPINKSGKLTLRSVDTVSPEENTQQNTGRERKISAFQSGSISKLFPNVTVHIRAVLTTFRRSLLSASWIVEHRQYNKHLHGTFTQKEDKNLKIYAYLLIKALEMLEMTC